MKPLPLVKVTWRDVCGNASRWFDADSAIGWAEKAFNANHITVGYLLHKGARYLVIGSTSDHEGSYNDISMIPRSMVKSITRLKE